MTYQQQLEALVFQYGQELTRRLRERGAAILTDKSPMFTEEETLAFVTEGARLAGLAQKESA